MDLRRPLQVITPTLDGDVLVVLAGADAEFTGRQVHELAATGSHVGIKRALDRLVDQGVVLRRPAGRAHLYRLNREHLAAPAIEQLAQARSTLVRRLREAIACWPQPPAMAVLFGSMARGSASTDSDLDVLVVRRVGVGPDDDVWAGQLADLTRRASAWTGNEARLLEYGEDEIADMQEPEPVLVEAVGDGIELFGSLRLLRRAMARL
jgi:hypothetical protein